MVKAVLNETESLLSTLETSVIKIISRSQWFESRQIHVSLSPQELHRGHGCSNPFQRCITRPLIEKRDEEKQLLFNFSPKRVFVHYYISLKRLPAVSLF